MAVPTAPASGVKEVHVSVKVSRDYQAVELSTVYTMPPGSDEAAMVEKHGELFVVLENEAGKMIGTLAGQREAAQAARVEARAAEAPKAAQADDSDFLWATKPDKAKGPKKFRYLPEDKMSKRELEDASKDLAAAKGFDRDDLIAFDNRDRIDRPSWGACVVKAKRGSDLAGRLGDRDTVGYTAWDAEGNLAIDVWAKL